MVEVVKVEKRVELGNGSQHNIIIELVKIDGKIVKATVIDHYLITLL